MAVLEHRDVHVYCTGCWCCWCGGRCWPLPARHALRCNEKRNDNWKSLTGRVRTIAQAPRGRAFRGAAWEARPLHMLGSDALPPAPTPRLIDGGLVRGIESVRVDQICCRASSAAGPRRAAAADAAAASGASTASSWPRLSDMAESIRWSLLRGVAEFFAEGRPT